MSMTAWVPAGTSIPAPVPWMTRLLADPVLTGVQLPGPETFETPTSSRSAATAARLSVIRTSNSGVE